MIFVIILLVLCVLLISLVMVATVIKLVLLITTKYKYETTVLLLPAFLTLLSWLAIAVGYFMVITKLVGMSVFDLALYVVITPSMFSNHVMPILLISIGFVIIGILFQALFSLTVNIDYTKHKGRIRTYFKKIFKIESSNENTEIVIDERPPVLTFSNSFVASLFSFALTFFSVIVLLTLGFVISNKLV